MRRILAIWIAIATIGGLTPLIDTAHGETWVSKADRLSWTSWAELGYTPPNQCPWIAHAIIPQAELGDEVLAEWTEETCTISMPYSVRHWPWDVFCTIDWHEMGHAFGIGHVRGRSSVMNPRAPLEPHACQFGHPPKGPRF